MYNSGSSSFAQPELLLIACLLLIAFIVRSRWSRRKNFPPGPFSFPILGYLPILNSYPPQKITEVGQKYGDIFSIRIGSLEYVVVNNMQICREFQIRPEFADRPDQKYVFLHDFEDPLFGNGVPWREHKKLALKIYKDLNAGKTMEELMKVKIKEYVEVLSDQNGKPCDARPYLFASITDIGIVTSFGKSVPVSEKNMIDNMLLRIVKIMTTATILYAYPSLRKFGLIRKILNVDELAQLNHQAKVYLRKKVDEQKGATENCFVGQYYKEMLSKKENDLDTTLSEDRLITTIIALFAAGVETVRDSLTWALYTVAVYKDSQREIHREIDKVIGRERTPCFSDQKDMRFTQAVLMEMQRWKTIIALGARVSTADTTIGPYQLPKGTRILINHYGFHRDPKYWKNPDEFMPERFLSTDGQHILKHDNYMPFAFGKRSCAGEAVAVMEVFLYFTSILQKFEVKLPEGEKPNFDGTGALSYQMIRHKICYIPRNVGLQR